MPKIPENMYQDAISRWNVFKGCKFECSYCVPSFQRQAKRQKPVIDKNGNKRGCQDCYDYKPHFHPERLNQTLPNTNGDQFIWACSSGDIFFAKKEWMGKILKRVRELPDKTFFFQTKNPEILYNYDWPDNVMLGITLESNRYYPEISKAPIPWVRYHSFDSLYFPRKIITIEPILDFDMDEFLTWISLISPIRIYIGYDTKRCGLPEPPIEKTRELITQLRENGFKVKEKIIRPAWWEK